MEGIICIGKLMPNFTYSLKSWVTLLKGNEMSAEDKASALIFLRHHIYDDLKNEYLTEQDPLSLWKSLKDKYDHQKIVILPNAQVSF